MTRLRKLMVTATILAVLLVGVAGALTALPSGITHHTQCEGTFAFDHSRVYDGAVGNVRYYHSMIREFTNPYYKVTRHVYRQTSTMQYPVWDHMHVKTNCPWQG